MDGDVLRSLADYGRFIAELLDRPHVARTTLAVWSTSPHTGVAEGEVFFPAAFGCV